MPINNKTHWLRKSLTRTDSDSETSFWEIQCELKVVKKEKRDYEQVTNRWVKRCSSRGHSTVLCSHPSRACAVSRYQLHTALRQASRLHKGVAVGGGGGGGRRRGVWLSHPSLKEAATTALFGVLNQSARHLRTLSPTSSSSHYLKGECFCAVVKYSRSSMMTTRVAPFNVNWTGVGQSGKPAVPSSQV